eukprot:1148394-Pelagomonas_calceolata.AAC.2
MQPKGKRKLSAQRSAPWFQASIQYMRSIGAYKWLRNKGFSNVKQLAAGMQDWRARHLPEQTQK